MYDIETAPWQVVESFETIDDKTGYWVSLINNTLDERVPLNENESIKI